MKIQRKYDEYLKSKEWKNKRNEVFELRGRKCARCESTAKLHIHHATYDRIYKENIYKDLFVLCNYCHNMYHSIIKGVTTIKKTRDFVKDKYEETDLEKSGKYDILQEKILKVAGSKKDYKVKLQTKFTKRVGNLVLKSGKRSFKYAKNNRDLNIDRLRQVRQVQDNERISNLKRMLANGRITQQEYDYKVNNPK